MSLPQAALFLCGSLIVVANFAMAAPQADGASVFDCLIDPTRMTDVSANGAGLIESIDVARGDKVVQGQVIARLRSALAEASLAILEVRATQDATLHAHEAQLEFVRRKRDRARTLVKQKVQSQSQLEELDHDYTVALSMLEQARLEKASAEAEAARARIELDELKIRAPNDGVITDLLAQPGQYTSGDHPILRMAQMDPLHVAAFLPIELYDKVATGQTVTVYPDAPVGGQYDLPIRMIDSVFDTASRTFGIEADLPNPDGALPAGHRCVLALKGDPSPPVSEGAAP